MSANYSYLTDEQNTRARSDFRSGKRTLPPAPQSAPRLSHKQPVKAPSTRDDMNRDAFAYTTYNARTDISRTAKATATGSKNAGVETAQSVRHSAKPRAKNKPENNPHADAVDNPTFLDLFSVDLIQKLKTRLVQVVDTVIDFGLDVGNLPSHTRQSETGMVPVAFNATTSGAPAPVDHFHSQLGPFDEVDLADVCAVSRDLPSEFGAVDVAKVLGTSAPCIGRLILDGETRGTCCLVSESLAITAAHCVEVTDLSKLTVHFGMISRESERCGNFPVRGVVEHDRELDYAVIRVGRSPGRTYGCLQLSSDAPCENLLLLHYPHPSRRLKISSHMHISETHASTGSVSTLHGSHKGSSGGVYIDARARIVAIHQGVQRGGMKTEWRERQASLTETLISRSPLLKGLPAVPRNLRVSSSYVRAKYRPFTEVENYDRKRIGENLGEYWLRFPNGDEWGVLIEAHQGKHSPHFAGSQADPGGSTFMVWDKRYNDGDGILRHFHATANVGQMFTGKLAKRPRLEDQKLWYLSITKAELKAFRDDRDLWKDLGKPEFIICQADPYPKGVPGDERPRWQIHFYPNGTSTTPAGNVCSNATMYETPALDTANGKSTTRNKGRAYVPPTYPYEDDKGSAAAPFDL